MLGQQSNERRGRHAAVGRFLDTRNASRWVISLLMVMILAVGLIVTWGVLRTDGNGIVDDGISAGAPSIAYGLLVDDVIGERTRTSEVVAFDETSGNVVARLATGDQPNVVPDPSGEKIFMIQTWWQDPTDGTNLISAIDTSTWEEVDSTTVESRIMYTIPGGPSTLALSPDGTRLLVFGTSGRGDYWLDLFDAQALDQPVERGRINLPRGCGGGAIRSTSDEVFVLCGAVKEGSEKDGIIETPLAMIFIDVRAARIVASVPLYDAGFFVKGKPAGAVVTRDRSSIFVVFNDLRIIEIDALTHQIVREVTDMITDEPIVFGVERSDEDTLLVGVRDNPSSWTGMTLRRFALPSLEPLEPISIQEFPRITGGPEDDLYQWKRDSTDLRRVDLDDGSVNVITLGGEKTLIADIVRSD